jgi:hypothetical protein
VLLRRRRCCRRRCDGGLLGGSGGGWLCFSATAEAGRSGASAAVDRLVSRLGRGRVARQARPGPRPYPAGPMRFLGRGAVGAPVGSSLRVQVAWVVLTRSLVGRGPARAAAGCASPSPLLLPPAAAQRWRRGLAAILRRCCCCSRCGSGLLSDGPLAQRRRRRRRLAALLRSRTVSAAAAADAATAAVGC